MTAAIANLALNVLMVALLVVTIAYCWILNRRIQVLQDSKSELSQLLNHFDESTQRASDSIMALQVASKKIGTSVQGRIEKANYMLDDLSYMIEKGDKLVNQLEASLAVGRARSKVVQDQDKTEGSTAARKPARPKEEKIYAPLPDNFVQKAKPTESLQVSKNDTTLRGDYKKADASKDKGMASIGAMLERITRKKAEPVLNRDTVSSDSEMPAMVSGENSKEVPHSKVEQELLDIIRAGVKG